MTEKKLYMVMDDTNNDYGFEDLADFEATLDPKVLKEHKAKTKSIFDDVFGPIGRADRAVA